MTLRPPSLATIILTSDRAKAVSGGEYASSSEIVREDLTEWRHKRALRERELAELRTYRVVVTRFPLLIPEL